MVYQAEIMAIHLAAQEAARVLNDKNNYIKLFSDSQAALKSLNKYRLISKVGVKAVESLNELGVNRQRLELNWMKAHNNYLADERADELSKNSAYHNIVVHFRIEPPSQKL